MAVSKGKRARPVDLRGKMGYVEIRLHPGPLKQNNSPNLIGSFDASYVIMQPDEVSEAFLRMVGMALLAAFDGDFSAYPKLEEHVRLVESGLIKPTDEDVDAVRGSE